MTARLFSISLENRPQQKWLCRIKVPNGAGYIYRGTGTSDFYEARRFADDLIEDLRVKVKLGVAITGKQFKRVFDEFEQTYQRGKISRQRTRHLRVPETVCPTVFQQGQDHRPQRS